MQRAWLVVLAVSMAGCPWGDDDSGDGRPHTVDELPGAYHSAACGYLVRCGQFPDRATCMSANLPRISDGFTFDLDPVLIAAIKAGRVQIDQARVDSCLAALTGLSCDRTTRSHRELYRQCWHYLVGTLPGGAACFANEECVSAQCSGGATDTCVAGTCVGDTPPSNEPAAIGMPCRFDPGCVDGAFCDFNETSTCAALLQAGEACVGANDCTYGLECVGNIVGNRFCERLQTLGEPCPDFICRDDGTYCADSGRCEAIGLEGDACAGAFEECADAYRCDASNGTCTRNPGLDEPCSTFSVSSCFDRGLVCDSTTATCIEPRPDGALCTVDEVCASRHCDTAAQQCRAVPVCF